MAAPLFSAARRRLPLLFVLPVLALFMSLCVFVQTTIVYDRKTLMGIRASVMDLSTRDPDERTFHNSLPRQRPECVFAPLCRYHRKKRARR